MFDSVMVKYRSWWACHGQGSCGRAEVNIEKSWWLYHGQGGCGRDVMDMRVMVGVPWCMCVTKACWWASAAASRVEVDCHNERPGCQGTVGGKPSYGPPAPAPSHSWNSRLDAAPV